MKLSENGLEKIQTWQSAVALGFPMRPNEIEFEPDDFECCVVLTVDEAKQIKDLIWKLQSLTHDGMNAFDWFTYWAMNGRIEQAEKCND